MAARKEIEKAVKFKEFQRAIEKLLTPEDKDYLFYAMKEYNTYKSVAKLMLALNSCLDTPEKLDLLPYIRDLIPKHEKRRFDHLAPYNRMAHPIKPEPLPGFKEGTNGDSIEKKLIRVVNLQRSRGTPLGFSIRGGQEHDLGIYVSHVESLSMAEKAGLQVGDKIVKVNGIDFERVSHSSAVLVLKSHDNLKIEVKNTGKVPGQTMNRNSFVWIDTHGKEVDEAIQEPSYRKSRHSISREERSPDRLLSSPDKHKIVLYSSKKRPLGFSIRGGNEYGLGIYISVVDSGSPSEEAGLKVGDQILDINGHSFLSILHFEAVHILRSYDTLIMTIKSLGIIPSLPKEEESGVVMEQSPITRRKTAEFFKSISLPVKGSKRPSSATITEEEEPDEPDGPSDKLWSKSGLSSLKRSESDRRKSASSQSRGRDTVDSPKKARSNSFGPGSLQFSQRSQTNGKRKQMVVSPLATHEARASVSSPISSPEAGPLHVKSKFFEKGIGTQVMLASMTSQAEQLLFDKARRVLSEEDAEILKEDLVQYEDSGNIRQFVDCLISIFNTPEKIELLRDVRSVVKPPDIVKFDEMISPHEVKALQERFSDSDSGSDIFNYDMEMEESDEENGVVLTGMQRQNGQARHSNGNGDERTPDTSKRAKSFEGTTQAISYSAPELYKVQTKETNLTWYDSDDSEGTLSNRYGQRNLKEQLLQAQNSPNLNSRRHGNSAVVEVKKDAPFIGLAIKTTPDNYVLVKDVRPGGAVDRDGFIKPGFEIVQVNKTRIRGKSYHEAAREIADAFKTDDGPTVRFIVIPNYP